MDATVADCPDRVRSRSAEAAGTTGEAALLQVWTQAFRTARRLGVPREDAEDVAQVIALHFFRRAPSIANPRAWVSAIVARRVRSLRARSCREQAGLPGNEPAVHPQGESDEAADLARVLDRLKPRDARFLSLALEGHSHQEIGRAMGVPASAVGVYLGRARNRAAQVWAALSVSILLSQAC